MSDLRPKIHQKSTSAPRGPRFTALPRPSWNKGDLLLSEGGKYTNEKGGQGQAGEGRGRERGREGNGEDPPYVSLNFP